jgi:Domain of unknown function (DUF4286)
VIIYEVSICAKEQIAHDYHVWLAQHVREMLSLPGFVSASVELAEPDDETGDVNWVVRYALSSHCALQTYFDQDAPRMRAAGIEKFGAQFIATRRILRPLVELLAI